MNHSRERDQAVDRLLRQSLARRESAASDACLDAEILAAWMDGALSGTRLELAESHVADCVRCQALVGAMARTAAGAPPEPEPARFRWLAWFVPVAAAATAVALWVAVPGDERRAASSVTPPAAPQQMADARPQESSPPGREIFAAPSATAPAAPPPAPRLEVPAPAVLDSPAAAPPALAKEPVANGAGARIAQSPEQGQVEALRRDEARERDANRAQAQTQEKSVDALADKDVASAAAQPAAGFVAAQNGAPRWRLSGSIVERSTNGGATWEAVPVGPSAELIASAAPSANVFWAVGRQGVVLLSTDGRTLTRVPFPETVDLSSVRATDARNAMLTTVDGRTFATTDGGATWRRP